MESTDNVWLKELGHPVYLLAIVDSQNKSLKYHLGEKMTLEWSCNEPNDLEMAIKWP